MKKRDEKIIVIALAGLVIFAFFYVDQSDKLFGILQERLSPLDWDDVLARNIVKNSIPIIILEESDQNCKVTAEHFDQIVKHPYFKRGDEFANELNFDEEAESLLIPCSKLHGEKSRLTVWYVVEESEKQSNKFEYWISPWNETAVLTVK